MVAKGEEVEMRLDQFLFELDAHIRVVCGSGFNEDLMEMNIRDLYLHLYPNDIVLGFRNMRMIGEYQLSRNMTGGI